jgi:hypothetical protein
MKRRLLLMLVLLGLALLIVLVLDLAMRGFLVGGGMAAP